MHVCYKHDMGLPRLCSSPPRKFLLNHCDDGLISGSGHYYCTSPNSSCRLLRSDSAPKLKLYQTLASTSSLTLGFFQSITLQ